MKGKIHLSLILAFFLNTLSGLSMGNGKWLIRRIVLFFIQQDFSSGFIVFTDLSLGFVMQRLLNPEHLVMLLAGPISQTCIQYMDIDEIFNTVLNLSTIIYFSHFSGC